MILCKVATIKKDNSVEKTICLQGNTNHNKKSTSHTAQTKILVNNNIF